ncbi:MAG: hypothetical protein AAFV53_33980 [Myxococcota bacterium]
MRFTMSFLALLLAGCLAEDVSSGLTETGGCADVLMYAANDTDTVALWANFNSLAYFAVESGRTIDETYDLNGFNQGENRVAILEGEDVTADFCVDITWELDPPARRRFNPVSGELSITIVPDEGAELSEPYSQATLELRDATFLNLLGSQRTIESLTLTEMVGWEPE